MAMWLLLVFVLLLAKLTGFWGGILFVPLCAVLGFCSMIGRSLLKARLIRYRMWKWGKNKFDSWDEFSEWLALTPFYSLNRIAETPDADWYPAKGGGVITTKPGVSK